MVKTLQTIMIVDETSETSKYFIEVSAEVSQLNTIGIFFSYTEAIAFVANNAVDLIVFDIMLENALEAASLLQEICPSAFRIVLLNSLCDPSRLIRAIQLEADAYLMKPFHITSLRNRCRDLLFVAEHFLEKKTVVVQTFLTFAVLVNGEEISLRGKAKEILAYLIWKHGAFAGRQEIESVVWPEKEFDTNRQHNTYYNAIKRLEESLNAAGISDLLKRTPTGCFLDTDMITRCDYYEWESSSSVHYDWNDFLIEFSWSDNFKNQFNVNKERSIHER